MTFLAVRAYLELIYFDLYLSRSNFAGLYARLRNCPVAQSPVRADVAQSICAAVDMASIWYWKEVLCLQRSAATALLLKQYGVPAQLIIGAQQMPFRAHAWVEVDELVVNDKPYMREMYAVLDRC